MSIREVNFLRDTIHGIAHLLGIDPEEDIRPDHARAWVAAINNKVRVAWEFWAWPELEVTEERAFRQVFYDDVIYQPGRGEESEVYDTATEKYWRLTQDAPAGTLPGEDANAWEEIALADLDKYIAYRQYGKQAIDRVVSVDPENPRRPGGGLTIHSTPSGYGIDVPFSAGPTVWITFVPRPPRFSDEAYRTDRTYRHGEVVLELPNAECRLPIEEEGSCWRALRRSTNAPLREGSSYWVRQIMPYVIAEYVKYSAAAENTKDAQLKAQLEAAGMDSLKGEVDKLIAQGQLSFYGRKMTIPPKPFGIPWGYYHAYWRSEALAI